MIGHEWMGHGFFMPWLVIPIIIVVCLMFIRPNGSCFVKQQGENEALEIARKRFARGEIDEETFDKIKQKLS
jgi:putative membrane protein